MINLFYAVVANDGDEPSLESEAWLLVRVESSSETGGFGSNAGGRDSSWSDSRHRVPQPNPGSGFIVEDGSGSGSGRRVGGSGSSSNTGPSSASGWGSGWMTNTQNTKLLLIFCIAIVLLVVIVCVVALLYLKYYYFDVSAVASGERRNGGRRGTLTGLGGDLYPNSTLDSEKRALDIANNNAGNGTNSRERRCLPMSQNLLQSGTTLRPNREQVVPAAGATLQSTGTRSRSGAIGVGSNARQSQAIFVPISQTSDRSRSVTPSRTHAVAVKRPEATQVINRFSPNLYYLTYISLIYTRI